MSGTYYRKQENKSCCPVCGKEYRASEFRRRWDGLWVCPKDYEERHPQDFVRARPDDMRPAVVAGCCGSDGYPQITTAEAPLCPSPLEPLDNATIGNATSVNLSWTTFPGISTYQIYFWEDGESQPASATYTTSTSPYFVTGLTEDTGYWWFVTAANEDGEIRDCSGNARFFTTALPIPACPVLTGPADDHEEQAADLDPVTVSLTWSASTLATSYKVYASIDGAPLALQGSTALLTFDLEVDVGSEVIWLVRAVNASGESSGCGSRSFSVTPPAELVTVYDTPGEYSWEGPNPFAVSVEVRVLGAGGGGGGGVGGSGTANRITGGGAGGGGAGAVETFTPAELVGPIAITVGAGGSGGAGGATATENGHDGENGGASRFGGFFVAGGGGGGSGGDWAGVNTHVGGGGGGGVQSGTGDASVNGGKGGVQTPGTAGSIGGAPGSTDFSTDNDALDAPNPSTDYGGGGGGGGDVVGSHGSVSLWGGAGGGGGSAASNGLPSSAQTGANGTASTGATDVPAGGAPTMDGEDGADPADPKMLAGSSGAGGGGAGNAAISGTGNGGNGGDGGRGSGGGGGGGIYVNDFNDKHGGAGGRGGDGYVVIIETNG